ncbi:Fungal Zn2-Cys6 binuclear cluster domain-containing protein [Cladophialophora immunda]|nr:Fungal Zn2-Cys6 binuclear cluster domain-containing protein [Cladophialophora immunda]
MNVQGPKKSRTRHALSCVPCRQRKIRCDRATPCDTCQRRGRIQLCRYGDQDRLSSNDARSTPERSKRVVHRFVIATPDSPFPAETSTSPQSPRNEDTASVDESVPPGSLNDLGETSQLIHFLDAVGAGLENTWHTEHFTGETIFLGSKSAASLFRCLSKQVPSVLCLPDGLTIESVFGLTNRTTLHPFGSLWSYAGNPSLAEILKALPGVESCMTYYRSFQQNVHLFYPLLLDPDDFESRLCDFMEKIGNSGIESALEFASDEGCFHDAAWYALLFGVLACGSQFSGPGSQDRVLKARVFVAGAFECLRLAHHYGIPSLVTIQTLLMIQFAIANDSNPGVALGVLGNGPRTAVKFILQRLTLYEASTSQQAQSLGLHVGKADNRLTARTIHPIWSMIMFFDYELSSAFGRIPVSFLPTGNGLDLPLHQLGTPPMTFSEFMIELLRLKQSWQMAWMHVRSPADTEPEIISRILERVAALEGSTSSGRLTQPQAGPVNMKLEQLMSTIYLNSFRAEILRCSSLSRLVNPELRQRHFCNMRKHIQQALQSLITLKQLSPTVVTSWTLLHCTMSSAMILAAFDCALGIRDSRTLLQRFTLCYSSAPRDNESNVSSTPWSDAVRALEYVLERASEEARGVHRTTCKLQDQRCT